MKYNGWANYETWNVALWMSNDEALHHLARVSGSYTEFCKNLKSLDGKMSKQAPDKVQWTDSKINKFEIDDLINSFKKG